MEPLTPAARAAKLPRSRDFLNQLQRKIADLRGERRPVSDYRVSFALDVTTATVSGWRTGRCGMSDAIGLKVSALLGLDERYVLACLAAERTRNAAVRNAWQRIAAAGVALPWVLVLLFALSGAPKSAIAAGAVVNTIHYAQKRRRRRKRWHGDCPSLVPQT